MAAAEEAFEYGNCCGGVGFDEGVVGEDRGRRRVGKQEMGVGDDRARERLLEREETVEELAGREGVEVERGGDELSVGLTEMIESCARV